MFATCELFSLELFGANSLWFANSQSLDCVAGMNSACCLDGQTAVGRLLLLELKFSSLLSGLLLDQSLEWAYVWGPSLFTLFLIPAAGPVPGVGVRLRASQVAMHLTQIESNQTKVQVERLKWATP